MPSMQGSCWPGSGRRPIHATTPPSCAGQPSPATVRRRGCSPGRGGSGWGRPEGRAHIPPVVAPGTLRWMPASRHPALDIAPVIADALATGRPVVALESTLISHGLPAPRNVEVALAAEAAVRAEGAVPATIAVRDGRLLVGLSRTEIETLAAARDVVKASRHNLAAALGRPGWAGTTVSATMIAAHLAGIQVFATGGIGGGPGAAPLGARPGHRHRRRRTGTGASRAPARRGRCGHRPCHRRGRSGRHPRPGGPAPGPGARRGTRPPAAPPP